ncbi:MAG: hypothetical protein HDT28_05115 [Clostridiales bacterium]|nr:hypothetical protein [Clostridiales bacterium]
MSRLNIPKSSRYRKRVGAFGRIDVKHDESTLDFNTAAECYNFDTASGALTTGYGVRQNKNIPATTQRYWVYRYYSDEQNGYVDQYVYQLSNGILRMYDTAMGDSYYISGTMFPPMHALNYRLNSKDVLLMSCEGRKLFTWDGRILEEHTTSPVVSSMALHYERLFVTSSEEPTKVFFSQDLDPTNWTIGKDGGGFIELLDERGYLNRVVSFGSYLYIFRDHGISRVTAYGDSSEFSVINLFVTAGRIYPDSIAVCGSVIVFLASDGLYSFDGYDCTRRLSNLDGLIERGSATASAFFDGKYYLSCRMNFADGETVGCEANDCACNGLLVYDVTSGEYAVSRGLDISFMQSVTFNGEDMLVCCESGVGGEIAKCGKRFDESLHAHWHGPTTDFSSPDKLKVLREAYVVNDVPVTVGIDYDGKRKEVNVKTGGGRKRLNVNCRRASVSVDCDGGECRVEPITVIYS